MVEAVQNYALRKTAKNGITKGKVAQNRLLSTAKLWLSWCVESGYIPTNPLREVSNRVAGGREKTRNRVLSIDELRKVWNTRETWTPLVRVLLATGCRISELQGATVGELVVEGDKLYLRIPPERHKSARGLDVPLSAVAVANCRLVGKDSDPMFRPAHARPQPCSTRCAAGVSAEGNALYAP